MERNELADFLRSRRGRVLPGDAGLPPGGRRRTPGLRREEVARLAGISVDYYTRLEQARGPHPSRQVLTSLARALRLTDDERTHLFLLAGQAPTHTAGPPQDVRPGILHLLDRLDDAPAMVLDAAYTILACNRFTVAIYGADPTTMAPDERNVIWRSFTADPPEGTYDPQSTECFRREAVADLRAAAARYPHDPGIRRLVRRLTGASPEFAALWQAHDVQVRRSTSKRLYHPQVGFFDVDCESLHIPERDQRLIVYSAAPGTPGRAALDFIRVVGNQSFSTS